MSKTETTPYAQLLHGAFFEGTWLFDIARSERDDCMVRCTSTEMPTVQRLVGLYSRTEETEQCQCLNNTTCHWRCLVLSAKQPQDDNELPTYAMVRPGAKSSWRRKVRCGTHVRRSWTAVSEGKRPTDTTSSRLQILENFDWSVGTVRVAIDSTQSFSNTLTLGRTVLFSVHIEVIVQIQLYAASWRTLRSVQLVPNYQHFIDFYNST
ncbi:hypothetical protein KCU85_g138, partial [Aureobasidium melanogenum]